MSKYLFLYIIVIFLFPLILMGTNAKLDYERIQKGDQKPDDKGISGFRRSTIALTFILIIGISLFHLIAGGGVTEVPCKEGGVTKIPLVNGEVVGNILSMLTGVVASIAGFYFGGKVALDSSSTTSPKSNNSENKTTKE